jgi:amylovoran biosynthesis glycosyltransferase AmsE
MMPLDDHGAAPADMLPAIDVLMAIHAGTDCLMLERSLDSLTAQEGVTLRLIIVFDGEVGADVSAVVEARKNVIEIVVLRHETNQGLARSLNLGLREVRSAYLLRADDDDIQLPGRALAQLRFMQGNPHLAASGTNVIKINDEGHQIGMRTVPTDLNRIRALAKYRVPINHPSAIIKTEALRAVGGYPEFRKSQDYALWCKFLVSGYTLANQETPLVKMYVGNQIGARRGWSFLKRELEAVRYAHAIGFTRRHEFFFSVLLRVIKRGAAECMQLLSRR